MKKAMVENLAAKQRPFVSIQEIDIARNPIQIELKMVNISTFPVEIKKYLQPTSTC
jgi:hypothetical protein